MSVTLLPSSPFYTGVGTSAQVPIPFPVGIGAHAYMIDVPKYRRRTLPALRPPSDTDAEPGENSLNTEGFWRRTQSDWSLGAGQDFFDNPDSSRSRFVSSKGVDVWTRDKLTLHYDTALRDAATATNLKTLSAGVNWYKVEGATLAFTTDPSAASPSFTAVTTTGIGTITGLATNGSTIYICDGTKIMQGSVGGSSLADLGSLGPDTLFFCNGRLIGCEGDDVYEITAAGAKANATDIKDHDNSSFVWNYAVGALNGIYISGNSGDRNEVYYLGTDSADGSLLAPVFAMNLPFGETLNCLEQYDRFILLGTSKGFRVALIGDDNGLAYGPLVEVSGGVGDFDFQGQYAWATCTNYDAVSTGLIRINLAEFTEPLVPAYATDLMATTQGTVQSVSTFAGKRYFAVSGVGFYGQETTRVASGTLVSSRVRFGTVERKVVSSIDFRHEVLAGTVAASVASDDGTITATATSSTAGSLGPVTPLSLGSFDAESFQVTLTLTRDSTDTTTGPTLRRWTTRAIATPFRTEEIIVPVVMATAVQVTDQITATYDPYDEFIFLKSLESSRSVIRYQEGSGTYNVYVDGVELQPQTWTTGNTFFNGLIVVRLLTVEATT